MLKLQAALAKERQQHFDWRNPLKLLHHTPAGLTLRASVERYVLSHTLRLQHLDRDAILLSELCDQ